jgi:hypothetical protein
MFASISMAYFSILIKGSQHGFFGNSQGLCQGDTLASPLCDCHIGSQEDAF